MREMAGEVDLGVVAEDGVGEGEDLRHRPGMVAERRYFVKTKGFSGTATNIPLADTRQYASNPGAPVAP
jgi:hypothetical protein